VGDSRAGDSRK
ncbi:unnamed protein product, partial [Oikopleura dioica]